MNENHQTGGAAPRPFDKIMVAGGGAWGTALAALLSRAGREVVLWVRDPALATAINTHSENQAYLPGLSLPKEIRATADPAAVADVDAMLCVIPAQHVRANLPQFMPHAAPGLPVALCSKGIEQSSGKLMHAVLEEVWPETAGAVLSGPSFAADVARGLPTAVTLADGDPGRGARWVQSLAAPTFRPYYSDDVLGAELGGAIKNVLAIACGVVEGRGLGESARAAVMARGFSECLRFATALGARPETLNGLSGLGDIILTCSSRQSRNMSLGVAIGQGQSARTVMSERKTVAEGAATAPILVELAARHGVEMPIAQAVAKLVAGGAPVDEVVEGLLTRPLRAEGRDNPPL